MRTIKLDGRAIPPSYSGLQTLTGQFGSRFLEWRHKITACCHSDHSKLKDSTIEESGWSGGLLYKSALSRHTGFDLEKEG